MYLTNPMQPIYKDKNGTARFKENLIVRYLLDNGGINLNQLAINKHLFSQDDQEQFAQLIGYSLCGFGELSYVSENTYTKAENSYDGTEREG